MPELDPVLITVICATQLEAENIAQVAVGRKLAAAGHYRHIHSVYRWNDEVVNPAEGEWELTLTTVSSNYDAICLLLPIWHSYSVPAITMVKISEATPDVLAWIQETTSVHASPLERNHSS